MNWFWCGLAVVTITAVYLMQIDPSGTATVAYILVAAIVYEIIDLWLYISVTIRKRKSVR